MVREPKKAAMLILAGQKKSDEPPAPPAPEESGDEGLEAAAEDLMSAVSAKDAKGVVQALRSFFDQVQGAPSDVDED